MAEFVPADFEVPHGLEISEFVLEPLGPEHNEQDYDAWTSSMDHIAATPGWGDSRWPREMTADENRADLERHADDFRNRTGFTYTVLDPATRNVIGCVYIYPLPESDDDARALSWVRATHATLDAPLWRTVSDWLASDWPFGGVDYSPRVAPAQSSSTLTRFCGPKWTWPVDPVVPMAPATRSTAAGHGGDHVPRARRGAPASLDRPAGDGGGDRTHRRGFWSGAGPEPPARFRPR